MDADLRRAERAGDWRAQASALRRAGRLPEARRVLSGAVKLDPEAWSLLDAWFPLSDEERGLLASLVKPVGDRFEQRRSRRAAAISLVGVGDPRFDAALEGVGHAEEDWGQTIAWLLSQNADAGARLLTAVELFGVGVLSRLRPTCAEVDLLLERFVGQGRAGASDRTPWSSPTPRVEPSRPASGSQEGLELVVVQLSAAYGSVEALRRLEALREGSALDPVADCEAWIGLRARGRAEGARPTLPGGAPFRPAWVEGPWTDVRDPITTAIHKRWFANQTDWSRGERLLLLDLDDTKRFNDRHGHLVGDALLIETTRRLQAVFGDRVVRWGGDEWLIPWKAEGLAAAAERARASVASLPSSPATGDPHGELRVTISGGIGRSLRQADEALNEAKRSGRNRVETWVG